MRVEGTNKARKNGEAMASVGVRVEPTVRLRRVVEESFKWHDLHFVRCA